MIIVYAHPNKDGHSGYCLKKVTEYLTKEKITYDLYDLYKMGYDPILTDAELKDKKNISDENKKIQDKISGSDNLIFIYPTWWQNMPAILKGFIDRVFSPGFAFEYKNGLPVGLLKGKRAAVFTSCGGPEIYMKLMTGDRSLKVMTVDTLKFCGIDARGYLAGSARELNDDQKSKIDKNVAKGMKYLFS
jgi:NAD(P)H dehydrogenase (quinone)